MIAAGFPLIARPIMWHDLTNSPWQSTALEKRATRRNIRDTKRNIRDTKALGIGDS
jgi:hypothetical protein